MKHLFYLTLLLLFYNYDCFITNYENKQFTYKFKNAITASNKASDKVLSQWTYSGNLIIQEYDDCKIFKLDDVKTSIFNGIRNNILEVNDTKISDDKKILLEPFGVYFKSLIDVNISVSPDDEPWSINIKKSIASSFLIDTSIDKAKTDTEHLIFGKCDVSLEILNTGSTKIIEKTINHKSCVEGPIQQSTNVEWMRTKNNHSPFQHQTKRIYVISKNNCLFSIDSSSNFTLQSSPDVLSTHRIEQNQYFELINTKDNTKPFIITKNTEIKHLIFEENTKTVDETQNTYMNNFIDAYANFKTEIKQKPLKFWDIPTKTPISKMIENLKKIDGFHLNKILLKILMSKDPQYYQIFLEILPYVGTKHTINLIKDVIKDDIDLHKKIKLLAIFTEYIEEINEDILKNFEEFLLYDYEEIQVKQTAVISFASLVAKAIEKNTIQDEIAEKYMKKMYNEFLDAKTHTDKIVYLLGLINISRRIPVNAILNIIYNKNESRHIKELAMYGFKNRLRPFGKEIFNKFWSIVKNSNENFETRVASLDLLLSCEISMEQFNEIINFYEEKSNNPYNKHLTNYIATTIISLQNQTGYQHYLGDWSTSAYQTKKIRQNLQTWTTGNYRFCFTDKNSNFGSSAQIKLTSDPKTNAINVVQLSFNQFALSMDLGEFNIYIKMEGIANVIFMKTFLANKNITETPIHELSHLIQQCVYQLKNRDDIFFYFVVFSGNRALFAMHFDQDVKNFERILPEITNNHISILYPIKNLITIPSDLGTELKINYDMQTITLNNVKNVLHLFKNQLDFNTTINKKILTQMIETITSNNPLLNTNINVEKLHHDFKLLDLSLSLDSKSINWINKNDNFNWVMQNTIYTYTNNETILKKNCINCNQVEEIPTGETKAECVDSEKLLNKCHMDTSIWRQKLFTFYSLGVRMNFTGTKESEEMENLRKMKPYDTNGFSEIINSHQWNGMTCPFVKPILYYLHLVFYQRYLENDLMKFSVRSTTIHNEPYTTSLKLSYDKSYLKNEHLMKDINKNYTLELSNVKNADNQTLSGIKLTFQYATNNDKTHKNIHSNVTIIADVLNQYNTMNKLCLNQTIIYPNRMFDRFTLDPINSTESSIFISWDEVVSFNDKCPPYFMKITEVLSGDDTYNTIIENSTEYETCKKEMEMLKYTPPTKSCISAHNALSLYRNYETYLSTYQINANGDDVIGNYKIFEYHHIDDKTINVSISRILTNLLELNPKPEFLNYEESSTFAHFISDVPTVFATKTERTCDITNKYVKTFFDDLRLFNESSSSKNLIAFVAFQVGLTFNIKNEINVVFSYWSGNNNISSNVESNEMKLYLNGIEINGNTQNDELDIYFIEKDVVFIQSDLVELYYTPVGLSIKIPTLFYKYLCGECFQ